MSLDRFTLLLVAGEERNWSLPDAFVASRFDLDRATIDETEGRLQNAPVDAALIWAERFSQTLLECIRLWKQLRPKAQFFLFLEETSATREIVALMHAGCQDVLESPSAIDLGALLKSIEERVRYVRIHQLERLQAKKSLQYTGLVGESPEMIKIYDEMLRAAKLNCPVLLVGETGTGKGLVAHAIHALSQRSGKPFVTVDCGCLAPTLIESELYGVARGAYTGATSDRSGLVQAAQEGTLFLDEIGELPLEMQPKLLRLLEEGEVRRLGSPQTTAIDVRVISASSRLLENLIASQQFRLDLYYRLNVLSIELAPLRQRRQDIPLLARHFASRYTLHGEPMTISDAALEVLAAYPWPGNIRELKNCIEAAVSGAGASAIHVQHLPRRLRPGSSQGVSSPPQLVNLRELERRAIVHALRITSDDKTQAARLLGIGKATLYRKLKQIRRNSAPLPLAEGPYLM